ncbi:MAG: glycosyltransferase family 4 protein [Acidobacteriaceae bacterium]|nr:glycosyltransferase family 4 protein [Acidobacteriaceae bacterium]
MSTVQKRDSKGTERSVGFITPVRAYIHGGRVYTHVASGRIANGLAQHYDKVYLCARVSHTPPESSTDLPLEASNIEVIEQPFWATSLAALKYPIGITKAYLSTCRRSSDLFIRGMCPYVAFVYLLALFFRLRTCHWIVGDPIAVLRAGERRGGVIDALSLVYAWHDRIATRLGRWLTQGSFICNGDALAHAYRSPHTFSTVSSTMRADEFYYREDTCSRARVRILFVGYIRPEKGLEYLLKAFALLKARDRCELQLVGPDQFPEYRKQLDDVAAGCGITDLISWEGYVSYGQPIFERMRSADIFVLPTLSEGTPHVLVEARANGLPCISTTVGGVPSTVTNEVDALLVPPRDPTALAEAIDRIISDGQLRRQLIRNGLIGARTQTIEQFMQLVVAQLDREGNGGASPVRPEGSMACDDC